MQKVLDFPSGAPARLESADDRRLYGPRRSFQPVLLSDQINCPSRRHQFVLFHHTPPLVNKWQSGNRHSTAATTTRRNANPGRVSSALLRTDPARRIKRGGI